MNTVALGAFIRTRRNMLGLTQAELGSLVGVTDRTILDYEKGRQLPRIGGLLRLLAALRTPFDDIVDLLDNDQATTDDAERMAQKPPSRLTAERQAFLESLTDDQLDSLVAFAVQFQRP